MAERDYNAARYEHHHREWSKAGGGRSGQAGRHLYALRAHLSALGWLALEYDKPGYGVRETLSPAGQVIEALRSAHACERDLYHALGMERLALRRLLKMMAANGQIERYDRGHFPGPVVTVYCLPWSRYS